jgi:DNA-binding CsgD family transcriptional regulator
LLALIGRVVPIDTAAVLAYRRNDIPLILFDRLQPAERGHFYEAYLSGVYLVSPFYRAFLDGRAPGFYPLRALAPQGFLQSEYYRKYYRHIGVADLIGGYVPLDKQTSLLLSFGRREGGRRFSRGELARLGRAEPVILALAARHWRDLGAGTPTASRTSDLHAQLLRGHSAKSAARELEISPETLRVHRKHIYAKLGVSSQGDLFALFLSSLPGKQP